MVAVSIIILIICLLLGLFVLAQNPKGGGLAAGFTGAQQIGGVQRTADFLEKGTWTLASALMVLCLFSASLHSGQAVADDLTTPTEALNDAPTATSPTSGDQAVPGDQQAPPEGQTQPEEQGD